MRLEVPRKVYFFRLADYSEFQPLMEGCVELIAELPFTEAGRYLETGKDDSLLALFVTSKKYPLKLQFGRIRRFALPMVEDAGQITPLQISQRAGIIDWSHIVIFEDGTVAAEFNRDGPHIARLGEYLSCKSVGHLPSVPRFYPLFQRSILEELENFEHLTALEIEASTTDTEILAEASEDLAAAFQACRNAGQTRKARLILKADRKPENGLKGLARRLFTNNLTRESLFRLKATGKTVDGSRPLNMLEEYLISTEEFMRVDNRTRALSPDQAFETLQRAYANKRERIADAAQSNTIW